jgi:hypothetical protein
MCLLSKKYGHKNIAIPADGYYRPRGFQEVEAPRSINEVGKFSPSKYS